MKNGEGKSVSEQPLLFIYIFFALTVVPVCPRLAAAKFREPKLHENSRIIHKLPSIRDSSKIIHTCMHACMHTLYFNSIFQFSSIDLIYSSEKEKFINKLKCYDT